MHRIPYNKSVNTMNGALKGIKIKISFAFFSVVFEFVYKFIIYATRLELSLGQIWNFDF